MPARPSYRIFACAMMYLTVCHGALADQLLMRDGSTLVGKVVKQENNTLHFETSFAGTIQVQRDNGTRYTIEFKG